MRSATRLFYLSVFALWASPGSCSDSKSECVISAKTIVGDACASFATLEKLNDKVKPALDELTTKTDFFSHYRLNLFSKTCPFWDDQNGLCGNIGCAVETLDNEDDIPEVWRARELSKVKGPLAKHPGKTEQKEHPDRPLQGELGEDVGESCVVEYDDECDERDYCVPEDESSSSKGDYVSLLRNPERFTGYGGVGAKQVWDAIYRENCFQKSSFPKSASLGISQWPTEPAILDFKQILDNAGRQAQLAQQRLQHPNMPFVASTGLEVEDECLEKRVFYRVISGMHASISAHLCWDFLNQSTGQWQPNLACYESRLHHHSDRISNLYFNYALLTRAVAKLGPYLLGPQYTFCTGDVSEDAATRAKVLDVVQRAASVPQIFDESLMFVNGEGPSLKEDFRSRFRNVSRLMDCVGCDRCRLWGKVQTNGYGTALKVLFEFDNNSGDIPILKRAEVVALFNTYARLGESLKSVGSFRDMLAQRDAAKPCESCGDESERATEKETTEKKVTEKETAKPEIAETEIHEEKFDDETAQMDEEDDDLVEFIRMRNRGPAGDGLGDHVEHEFARFLKAVKIVIKSWVKAPKILWEIFSDEIYRLYRAWIGLPPQPRRYEFKLPNLDRDDL